MTVIDRTSTNPPAVVANVPLGVAFFASMTSHVGDWLTRSFETVFSLPNEVRFQGGGLLFGSRVLQEARRAAIDQPVLQRDMIQFVKECVIPELINRTLDVDTLVRSTNIWGDIGAPGVLNPGRFVTYDLGANVDTCPMVYGVLNNRLYDRPWIAGDDYTIADMICYPWTTGWQQQGEYDDQHHAGQHQ